MEKKEIKEEKVVNAEPTIEQCNNMIAALKSQNAQLIHQLQNANMINLFKRLDYLFKVVENAAMFDESFVEQCITEIKELMTPPVPEEKEEN